MEQLLNGVATLYTVLVLIIGALIKEIIYLKGVIKEANETTKKVTEEHAKNLNWFQSQFETFVKIIDRHG